MATPPTAPALRERYDRRRGDLVERAARLFATRGYDQTAMPELAAELGIAVGGLYHYVGSKETLLIEICDALTGPLIAPARRIAEGPGDARERLGALVRLWVGHVVAHRDHMLVFQQERHLIEAGAAWRSVRADRKRFERLVDELLADALADGDDPRRRRLAVMALLGMVNHTAQWYAPRGPLRPDEIADGYVGFVLGG